MKNAIIALSAILVSNILIVQLGLQSRILWIDTPYHLVASFFVAMLFWHFSRKDLGQSSWVRRSFYVVSTVVLVGVLWEFMETAMWIYFTYYPSGAGDELLYKAFNYSDTIKDLVMDFTGAGVYLLLKSRQR